MAENNFFGPEDISDIENVNSTLFSDALPDDANQLESIKKKQADDLAAKAKTDAEKAKADAAEAARKAKEEEDKKKGIDPKKKKEEEDVDATDTLFGTKKEKEEGADNTDEEEKKEDETQEEDDSNKTQFEILSKALYDAGVFQPEIDEDEKEVVTIAKTPEEFKQLFEDQKTAGMYQVLGNYLSRFGESHQKLFNAVFEKGVDPKDYLPVFNTVQSFEGLKLEGDETAQEKVVREFYTRNRIPEDKINKKIQSLKDTAELQEEAETFLPQIIEQDKAKLKAQEDEKQASIKAEEGRDVQYKSSLVKILNEKLKTKEFDGIPLSEKRAQQAFDLLYNKKWQGADGKKFTDFDKFILELNKPENHALKVKVGLLALDNFDLSKVKIKAISDESNQLFSELTTKKTKQANKAKTAPADWNL